MERYGIQTPDVEAEQIPENDRSSRFFLKSSEKRNYSVENQNLKSSNNSAKKFAFWREIRREKNRSERNRKEIGGEKEQNI